MSADSLMLLFTGLKIVVLLAFIAIPWTDGARRRVFIAMAFVGTVFFLADNFMVGYRQQDLPLAVDLMTVTVALAALCYLASYVAELIIRKLLLRDGNDRS